MNKNILVHLCTAHRVHLIPARVGFSSLLPELYHVYLFVGARTEDKSMYAGLVEEHANSQCYFIDKLSDIYTLVEDFKQEMIFTHGFSYIDCFKLKLHGFKNVHWVCWGESVVKRNSLASLFFWPVKGFMMNQIDGVITLMDPDKSGLMKNYGVKKVVSMAYPSVKKNYFTVDYFKKDTLHYRVLLGNNPDCIPYHGQVLDLLKKYVGKIKVDCLLNYSLVKNKVYSDFVKKGHDIFGDDFNTIEDFMSKDEYVEFLKNYDIYICNMPEQTGLGANNRCFRLGKKIFLVGSNYEWFSQIGCYLYQVKEIENMSFEEFIKPLSEEQKIHNLNTINKCRNTSILVEKWKNYIMSNI